MNAGIGTFSLPSTGYTTVSPESRLQLTETMVLGAKVVNETRFQFLNDRSTQDGPQRNSGAGSFSILHRRRARRLAAAGIRSGITRFRITLPSRQGTHAHKIRRS